MERAVDYVVIAAYFVCILGAGYWGMRRARNAEDYLVAGRRLGFFMFAGTMSAVVLGGASTIGGISLGYQYGISGMWLVFLLGFSIILLGVLLSTRLSRSGVYSIAEMLEARYGGSSRLISAIVIAVYELMLVVTQTIAIGTIFNAIFGVSQTWAILIAGGVVVLYSAAGGMWSITLTDILQFCVMTVGIFFLLLPLALWRAGGFAGMREELPASYFNLASIGWGTIFAYVLLFVLGNLIAQDIWQRVFTGRSVGVARWGSIAAGIYSLLYGLAGALIGTAARTLFPNLETPDDAFAQVATAVLPVGVLGLVISAALAAVMSTASGTLMAASTVMANDIYGRFVSNSDRDRIGTNRAFMVTAGIVAIGFALILRDVIVALTVAYDLLVGALFVPIIGALFWKRATSAGALTSILAGSVVVITLLLVRGLSSNDPIIYGLLTSFLVFVAVSLMTPKPSIDLLEAWERRMSGPVTRKEPEEAS